MTNSSASIVKQRQEPLRERYRNAAGDAWIVDCARTLNGRADDPFHGTVVPGEGHDDRWRFGIHRAVGGDHDLPNPGDLLCAALAACLDATLRMVANRLEVGLRSLEVKVRAEVDVRGTLVVDRSVAVGFQRIDCAVDLETEVGADAAKVRLLMAAAEHSCVVLQTLRAGVTVQTKFNPAAAKAAAE